MARRKTVKKTTAKKKTSRKASAKKSEAKNGEPHPLGPLLRQSLLVLLCFGALVSGLNAVEQTVQHDSAYKLKADSLTLGVTPSWMIGADELRDRLDIPFGEVSIFDSGLENLVRKSLESASWVRSVSSVQKVLPCDLEVSFEPRRPIARIRRGFKHLLVDIDGVLLPSDVYTETASLPFLDGIEAEIPREGSRFKSPALEQVLGLMRAWHESGLVEKYPDMTIMKVVCATPRQIASGEPEFVVSIPRRVRLYFDAGDEEGEISFAQALKNFEKILFRDPHLGHIKDRIDLRWKRPALR